MTDLTGALSEIKRRAVRTELFVWERSVPVKCICITEDALREALKEVFGKASVLGPEPGQHTRRSCGEEDGLRERQCI